MKMSDEDAEWLYPGVPEAWVIDRLLSLGPALVALTFGAAGAALATSEHHVRVPAKSVDAVDTIGAGDTFMASLIDSILTNGLPATREEIEALGADAVTAAAITVSRAGADLPWAWELDLARSSIHQ